MTPCLRIALVAAAAIAAVPMVSCRPRVVVVEHDVACTDGPREEIVVAEQAPAPRVEVIPAAPSADHVWIAGYWSLRGGNWVWVAGHWARHPRGWVWVHGHWR